MDSSVVLSALLRESEISEMIEAGEVAFTSELTELECRRTLDRIRILEELKDDEIAERLEEVSIFLQSVSVIQLTSSILKRAKAPYPTVVRSLDAIHLASAELGSCKLFVTRDKQQAIAAKAMGFEVPGR